LSSENASKINLERLVGVLKSYFCTSTGIDGIKGLNHPPQSVNPCTSTGIDGIKGLNHPPQSVQLFREIRGAEFPKQLIKLSSTGIDGIKGLCIIL
jgi:hypothetical protein